MVEQLQELLKALAAGAVLAAVYDFFRIIRKIVKHGTVAVSGEDLIFWIVAAFMVFRFFLSVDDGKFRMYMILGLMAGVMAYRMTLGRLLVGIFGFFFRKIKEICGKLLKKAVNKPKIKEDYQNVSDDNKVRGGDIEKQ